MAQDSVSARKEQLYAIDAFITELMNPTAESNIATEAEVKQWEEKLNNNYTYITTENKKDQNEQEICEEVTKTITVNNAEILKILLTKISNQSFKDLEEKQKIFNRMSPYVNHFANNASNLQEINIDTTSLILLNPNEWKKICASLEKIIDDKGFMNKIYYKLIEYSMQSRATEDKEPIATAFKQYLETELKQVKLPPHFFNMIVKAINFVLPKKILNSVPFFKTQAEQLKEITEDANRAISNPPKL